MYLIDADVVLEVLYKGRRWKEAYNFLNAVKRGVVRAYMLHFAIHGISAILGEPSLVARFLAEISTWRGLSVVDLSVKEEAMAARSVEGLGLDFDDGLHYYVARERQLKIVSFDRDFDKVGLERLEPGQVAIEG